MPDDSIDEEDFEKISVVDFEPFLESSIHPQIKKYKNIEHFFKI